MSWHYFSVVIVLIGNILLINSINLYGSELSHSESYTLKRLFPSEINPSITFDSSIIASPLIDLSQGKPLIIVPASNGHIAAMDSETGILVWEINAPLPKNQEAQLISTPIIFNDKLVILYQCLEKGLRISHRMAVIDLVKKQLDDAFPVLILSAEKSTTDGIGKVKFNPSTAFSHSALKHGQKPGSKLGYLYAAFGNSGDEQPFHGWLFEIDMDAWQNAKQKNGQTKTTPSLSKVLVTTPEADCPVKTELYGTQEMICGGGIWSPPGPQVYSHGNEIELFVPTGNGQIDLNRHDYANTIMRLKPGLKFDAGCDAKLCANFNPTNPDTDCISSCKNLFIPRLMANDAPLRPANGECDDKSYWECLAWMDYDLGASAPVKIDMNNGLSLLVQPSKDGSIYLINANHLGTQYDRLQIVDVCGTKEDQCVKGWMGMIATQVVSTFVDGTPVVVIPTFVPDKTHPAGLVALKIVLQNGLPKFQRFWQFPDPSSIEAIQTFRNHTSLPVITEIGENRDPTILVVDINQNGTVYGVRIKDGQLIVKQTLKGTGRQDSFPLIYRDNLYLASIMPGTSNAMIEAYHIDTIKDY